VNAGNVTFDAPLVAPMNREPLRTVAPSEQRSNPQWRVITREEMSDIAPE
jgi:hypothetical protein